MAPIPKCRLLKGPKLNQYYVDIFAIYLPPWKLTCQLKISGWKMKFPHLPPTYIQLHQTWKTSKIASIEILQAIWFSMWSLWSVPTSSRVDPTSKSTWADAGKSTNIHLSYPRNGGLFWWIYGSKQIDDIWWNLDSLQFFLGKFGIIFLNLNLN